MEQDNNKKGGQGGEALTQELAVDMVASMMVAVTVTLSATPDNALDEYLTSIAARLAAASCKAFGVPSGAVSARMAEIIEAERASAGKGEAA